MGNLKKLKTLAMMLALVCTAFMFNACETECDGVECLNGGECQTNSAGIAECVCPDGFSGPACEIQDLCFGVECGENATCSADDGNCYCDTGYEPCEDGSADCGCEIRAKYFGTYSGQDVCPSGTFLNSVTLSSSSTGITFFLIEGFGGFDSPAVNVPVEILDDTQFRIPLFTDSAGRTFISGTDNELGNEAADIGTYSETDGQVTLQFTYKVGFSDNTSEVCDATLTKQ